MRYVLVGSSNTEFIYKYNQDDFLIALDGGYNYLKNYNINLFIGDMDSINTIIKAEEKIILNPIKDESDLEYALNYIIKKYQENDEIVIYNCTGNRLDHTLATLRLIIKYKDYNIKLIDSSNIMYIKSGTFSIDSNYKYVSFFNILENTFISLVGFKYPLNNYKFKPLDNLCLSNEILSSDNKVIVNKSIVVIQSKDLS